MRTLTLSYLLAAAGGALAQESTEAQPVGDSPVGAMYEAVFTGDVIGNAFAGSDPFGNGVAFHIDLIGLPSGAGPFGTSPGGVFGSA